MVSSPTGSSVIPSCLQNEQGINKTVVSLRVALENVSFTLDP